MEDCDLELFGQTLEGSVRYVDRYNICRLFEREANSSMLFYSNYYSIKGSDVVLISPFFENRCYSYSLSVRCHLLDQNAQCLIICSSNENCKKLQAKLFKELTMKGKLVVNQFNFPNSKDDFPLYIACLNKLLSDIHKGNISITKISLLIIENLDLLLVY